MWYLVFVVGLKIKSLHGHVSSCSLLAGFMTQMLIFKVFLKHQW